MKWRVLMAVSMATAGLLLAAAPAAAQTPLKITPLAEKKVPSLPAGQLYWQIERFASLPAAQAAAGPYGLAVESRGSAWLFRLGAADLPKTAGGEPVASVGPVPRFPAAEYLLRINEATGAPGSVTAVHTHPGSEAFFVLSGEQSIRTPGGVLRVSSGRSETGHGADVPMQVSSSGATDLHALVMFVVDAGRPFSSPAKLD